MQTTKNKTLSSTIQNQDLSHVDNFKNFVTSLLNNSKKSLNNKKFIVPLKRETKMSADEWNAMVSSTQSNLMFNKSLRKIPTQQRNYKQTMM